MARIVRQYDPTFNGAAVNTGDGTPKSIRINSGAFPTPFILRTEAGLDILISQLPWQGMVPSQTIQILTAAETYEFTANELSHLATLDTPVENDVMVLNTADISHNHTADQTTVTETGGGAEILFFSNWQNALGNSRPALFDGATSPTEKWVGDCGNYAAMSEWMDVVEGDAVGWTRTDNCLEMANVSSSTSGFMRPVLYASLIPLDTSFYVRCYIKVDGDSFSGHNHPFNLCCNPPIQIALWAIHTNLATTYKPFFNIDADGPQKQFECTSVPKDEWLRFEWFVELYDLVDNEARVWPRIYNSAGTLIKDSDDYIAISDSQTLTDYYNVSGGHMVGFNSDTIRRLTIGNEGSGPGESLTGLVWYASCAIGTGDWLGEV